MSRDRQNKQKKWLSRMDKSNEYNHAPSPSSSCQLPLRLHIPSGHDSDPEGWREGIQRHGWDTADEVRALIYAYRT